MIACLRADGRMHFYTVWKLKASSFGSTFEAHVGGHGQQIRLFGVLDGLLLVRRSAVQKASLAVFLVLCLTADGFILPNIGGFLVNFFACILRAQLGYSSGLAQTGIVVCASGFQSVFCFCFTP